MTRAEEAALKAYPKETPLEVFGYSLEYSDTLAGRKGFIKGYEQSQQDIIAVIQSRIGEILGDAQPNPILRMELQELIKKIES